MKIKKISIFLSLLISLSSACHIRGSHGVGDERHVFVSCLVNKLGGTNPNKISHEKLRQFASKLSLGGKLILYRAGGIDSIINKCDVNTDGYVDIVEFNNASRCLPQCWQQKALGYYTGC